ncbi:hypothetical protein F5Y01DRAFT_155272 [Xylaria sp. FL0043]|nr:hypothetical protein F5Y01DRAFT_155272 [Xylaria sp. FL0043]
MVERGCMWLVTQLPVAILGGCSYALSITMELGRYPHSAAYDLHGVASWKTSPKMSQNGYTRLHACTLLLCSVPYHT